jgi:hypothetical protein
MILIFIELTEQKSEMISTDDNSRPVLTTQ